MTLDNPINFEVREHRNGDKGLYIIRAKEGYCFRNNAEPIKDADGNVYFEHIDGFMVLSQNVDELKNYDCITLEEAEKEKVPEGITESVPEVDEVIDEDRATEEDYIQTLEELGVTFDE